MQLPRTTIRRWIVAVFALSVMMYAARTWFCWKERSERAEYHRQAVRTGFCNTCGDNFPRDLDFIAIYYREVEPQRAWHARMAKMYELAAACPWLPFDIDAAEPK